MWSCKDGVATDESKDLANHITRFYPEKQIWIFSGVRSRRRSDHGCANLGLIALLGRLRIRVVLSVFRTVV